jgi:hypothetical protein
MKGDFKNELQIRLTLTIIYTALNILVKTGDIREFETSSTKIRKDITGKVWCFMNEKKRFFSLTFFIVSFMSYLITRLIISNSKAVSGSK